jgi:hypothetical protein
LTASRQPDNKTADLDHQAADPDNELAFCSIKMTAAVATAVASDAETSPGYATDGGQRGHQR